MDSRDSIQAEKAQFNRSQMHPHRMPEPDIHPKVSGVPPMKRPDPKFGFYGTPLSPKNVKAKNLRNAYPTDRPPSTKTA